MRSFDRSNRRNCVERQERRCRASSGMAEAEQLIEKDTVSYTNRR